MGQIGDAGSSDPGSVDPPERVAKLPNPDHVVQIGLRRLTPYEYDNTVRDLLGVVARPSEEVLPLESTDEEEDFPFDTNFEAMSVSAALIGAAETLAQENVDAFLADPMLRDRVVGCTPTGPGDEACMRTFVESLGRRAFRRPLETDDVDRYLELQRCSGAVAAGEPGRCGFSIEADDFYAGVAVVIEAMLISPRFLYRVEIGTPSEEGEGVHRLDGFEIAARLSYLLWGTTPDDALLNAAAAGELDDASGIRAHAEIMLTDPRARQHIARFHAQWLGYANADLPEELAARMRRETDALVQRVIFDDRRPWADLFLMEETFVDDVLAEHYGLPTTGSDEPSWVRYPEESGRRGLLSHGSFLSLGVIGGDTRPIHRGKWIMTMLLCQPIPPPPPGVEFPDHVPGECKSDELAMHASGGCAGCHQYMDGLGAGLERFDGEGRYRELEHENPSCEIEGVGALPPLNGGDAQSFSGPAELGTLMVESGRLQACATTQLFRYAVGRNVRDAGVKPPIHEEDVQLVNYLIGHLGTDGRFDELLLELVSSPFFMSRIEY